MPGDHQPRPELDADILQCKMDLRNALAATRRMSKDIASAQPSPVQSTQPIQPAQSIQPDFEIVADDPQTQHPSPDAPSGAQILSFEEIHKRQDPVIPEPQDHFPLPDAVEDQSAAGEQIQELNQTVEQLGRQLETEKQKSEQLSDHSEQLRLAIADREADIRLLRSDLSRQDQELNDARLRLGNSAFTIEQLNQRIAEVETELAEKIGQLTTLKQQAEEAAEALAGHSELLHRAEQEKELAEKRLEAQAAQWAKTVETLKFAQEEAAQTLHQRQTELDALRQALAETEDRLELSESANAELEREKTELADALNAARQQAEENQTARTTFAFDDTEDFAPEQDEPEPYCEPVAEVISEDDVHLEQQLNTHSIPTFNLAEQIMAEQRKAAAARRQAPQGSSPSSEKRGIEEILGQFLSDVEDITPQPPAPRPTAAKERTGRFERWQGEQLSSYQQSLLTAIVQKDILFYCGMESRRSASDATPQRHLWTN